MQTWIETKTVGDLAARFIQNDVLGDDEPGPRNWRWEAHVKRRSNGRCELTEVGDEACPWAAYDRLEDALSLAGAEIGRPDDARELLRQVLGEMGWREVWRAKVAAGHAPITPFTVSDVDDAIRAHRLTRRDDGRGDVGPEGLAVARGPSGWYAFGVHEGRVLYVKLS